MRFNKKKSGIDDDMFQNVMHKMCVLKYKDERRRRKNEWYLMMFCYVCLSIPCYDVSRLT
jgi:hypothetical protein